MANITTKKNIDEVFAMSDNRYALVNTVATRAREIAENADKRHEPLIEKPVNIVLGNLMTGKSTIVRPSGSTSLYQDTDFELSISVEED